MSQAVQVVTLKPVKTSSLGGSDNSAVQVAEAVHVGHKQYTAESVKYGCPQFLFQSYFMVLWGL